MNKKRDLLSDLLTWFLIVVFFLISLFCDFCIIRKMQDNITNIPNVVLNEKKSINNDLEYFTPKQSSIFYVFTTESTTTSPFSNIYAMNFTLYSNLDIDTTTFYGLNGYLDICISNSQRYYDSSNSYEFSFNDNEIESFDFQIDYEILINDFENISCFIYADSIERNEMEIVLEVYINGNYYTEYYYIYTLPIAPNIYQSFNLSLLTEIVNIDILDNYTLGYDRGYYDGKLDGYDEGYYDKEEEYNSTDSAFQKVWNIISNAFASVFNVFNIDLFPGLKLFHILAIPLIISVLYFVIKILAK